MTPEQWITAYWLFGTVFAVLAVMIVLTTLIGGPRKPKEAWQHHEDSLDGRY